MIYQCSIEHTLRPVMIRRLLQACGEGFFFFLDAHTRAWLFGAMGRKRSLILVACPESPLSCLDREASATCHDPR